MGNSNSIIPKKNKKTILWIDRNMHDPENMFTYECYGINFNNYNFIRLTKVDQAINMIKENKEYFNFKLFYLIISGKLAEEFFDKFASLNKEKEISIIGANIVYCSDLKTHESKPYFKDSFLNPGKVTTDFQEVIDYIKKDETNWKNRIKEEPIVYRLGKEGYGNVFINIDSSKPEELAMPILIGKLINTSLLEEEDLYNFQEKIFKRYKNTILRRLIFPSQEKKMEIPLNILAKYFIRIYTLPTEFYRDMNRDLSNEKFDEYLPFIFLLYDALNKDIVGPYKDSKLYRGTQLNKGEFKSLEAAYNLSKNDQTKKQKALYFTKNFFSFSKSEKVCDEQFMEFPREETYSVKFILDPPTNKNFFVPNIDIKYYSFFKDENEVLFFPMTCFEIFSIKEKKMNLNGKELNYKKIKIKYLDEYTEAIEKTIEQMKKKENPVEELNKFFEKSLKSSYGTKIVEYYDKKNKIVVNYCKALGGSADNNYFVQKIGNKLLHKLNKFMSKYGGIDPNKKEGAIHLDDELCLRKINAFLEKIDNKNMDYGQSIGVCIGNFIYNYKKFKDCTEKEKKITSSDLLKFILAAITPLIKFLLNIIPGIKEILKQYLKQFFSNTITPSTILNFLNVLFAIFTEFYAVFKFYDEHKKLGLTLYYLGKRIFTLSIGVSASILSNVGLKLVFYTASISATGGSFLIGVIVGSLAGVIGGYYSNKWADEKFGEDKFILSSDCLYSKYLPDKYRLPGNNPKLSWNKSILCKNVKSYVIECIVNGVEVIMRVANISKDTNKLDECIFDEPEEIDNDNLSALSTDISLKSDDDNENEKEKEDKKENEKEKEDKKEKKKKDNKNTNKKKLEPDELTIPYKGIKKNCSKINFVIYGLNREKVTSAEWSDPQFKKDNVEVACDLSAF